MRRFLTMACPLLVLSALAEGTPAAAAQPQAKSRMASFVAKAEQMAMKVLPQEDLDRAAGFFGPVTKKYLPVAQAFQRDYTAAQKKLPVIKAYLPKAEAAFAEAKAMKVPAKYEAEKQKYLEQFEAFLSVVRMSLLVAN